MQLLHISCVFPKWSQRVLQNASKSRSRTQALASLQNYRLVHPAASFIYPHGLSRSYCKLTTAKGEFLILPTWALSFPKLPSFPSLQSLEIQVMPSLSPKHTPSPSSPSELQPSFHPWVNPAPPCLRTFALPVFWNVVSFISARLMLFPHWDLGLNTTFSDKLFLPIWMQTVTWGSAPTSLFKFPAQHVLLADIFLIFIHLFNKYLLNF